MTWRRLRCRVVRPFLQDFSKYESWIADCTLKELWARSHRFGISIQLGNLPLKPPREGDRWFMAAIEEVGGFSKQEREILNRVRLSQEVVFESDVFGPDGRHLDATINISAGGPRAKDGPSGSSVSNESPPPTSISISGVKRYISWPRAGAAHVISANSLVRVTRNGPGDMSQTKT
jgi:hypothetical protein